MMGLCFLLKRPVDLRYKISQIQCCESRVNLISAMHHRITDLTPVNADSDMQSH